MAGPAWKTVAGKYRNDATAEEKLIAKASKGDPEVRGRIPMPDDSPAVKNVDTKALIKFVLSLR